MLQKFLALNTCSHVFFHFLLIFGQMPTWQIFKLIDCLSRINFTVYHLYCHCCVDQILSEKIFLSVIRVFRFKFLLLWHLLNHPKKTCQSLVIVSSIYGSYCDVQWSKHCFLYTKLSINAFVVQQKKQLF